MMAPKPLKHRGKARLHKQVGSDTFTSLKTMRIIPLHPPALVFSGPSDKLSTSALFSLYYHTVTKGKKQNSTGE